MPGARLNTKPESADDYPASIEEANLELHLQRQLEEDVASDAYTECNIQHQEKEIITYLDNNLNIVESVAPNVNKVTEDLDESEVFLTPECTSPYVEKGLPKPVIASPSTELTKEYYALVPIERNLLDKELIEQDALSNAFQSIIKSQTEDSNQNKITQRNKPTSLSLTSSHTSKTVKHSNSCDILSKNCLKDNSSLKVDEYKIYNNTNTATSQDSNPNQVDKVNSTTDRTTVKNINTCEAYTEKQTDLAYSPDSLISDDPSSSSDCSAAYTCSLGAISSSLITQLNVGISTTKMENIFTLSDSGLENTAMLGSINSHKDVTLTDVSLSESTLHDFAADDASNSAVSISSSLADKDLIEKSKHAGTSSEREADMQTSNKNIVKEISGKSLKEEKQRQNEEIVILESSSLSSETGSWESVYPPKFLEKDTCEKFLNNERQYCYDQKSSIKSPEHYNLPCSLVQKSPFKATSCFIDAASLIDEDESIEIPTLGNDKLDLPAPSQPLPCSTAKLDISPNDWSEGNENEDSLEQADKKDPDSIQKDLSPTIFEMTPITEDSLCTNTFETAHKVENEIVNTTNVAVDASNLVSGTDKSLQSSTMFMFSTPNNSIMSLKTYRHYDSDDSKSIEANEEGLKRSKKGSRSPPILSGGVSVEDHLPLLGSSRESSPLPKWKLDNVPIVSGAHVTQNTEPQGKPRERTSSASAWVVDMSIDSTTDESLNSKKSEECVTEKKNMFSMYIDLGDKSTVKEMPSRLSSSINAKKNASSNESTPNVSKSTPKSSKSSNTSKDLNVSKEHDINNQSVSIFEKYESLCNDPNISISEIIGIPEKPGTITDVSEDSGIDISKGDKSKVQLPDIKKTPPKPEVIKEEPTDQDLQSSDLFVKLSDLDKPIQKSDITVVNEPKEVDARMTRSIPDRNWSDQPLTTNSRSIEVISSFHSENALSLNRLFPHLKNEFSKSMPGSLSSRTRSPLRLGVSSTLGDPEEQASDMSEVSSMQSSVCRSGFGNSTTDSQTSSLIENCTSRLGQDLLRMFLEEIAPDVIVEVSGKRFRAHKCILSSRCQYFAGILSGGWVESLGNVIVLPPFSYNVVYFALCHIYSGLATIPDSVSIVELATIADMLGLEGLKEAIMFTLKAKYCHHFHKPCAVCVVGVLECFPLSSVYGLDDLYHKCLKWITKHFSKVWPTKAFATLPTDLLDKCYQHHIVNLSVDSLVDTVYGCGITASSLQNSRWAESVARMCRRLISAAAHYAAPRLVAVFRTIEPLSADAPHAAKQALDDCIAAAIDWAPPEEACRAYDYLSSLIRDMRGQHYAKPDLISSESTKAPGPTNLLYTHASSWRLQCEGALVRATPRVVSTQAFKELPSDLRKRLRELGCIMYGTAAIPVNPSTPLQDRRSRSSYHSKTSNKNASLVTRSVDIAQVRASFVPYAPKPVIPLGSMDKLQSNSDLRDYKKPSNTVPPKVRTTKAQEERARFNKYKNDKSQERLNGKAMRVPTFESTKSRYLNPKSSKENKLPVVRKFFEKLDSSSDSSRNSSPVMLRNLKSSSLKPRHAEGRQHAMSQDSLATSSRPRTAEPSTDSLSESQNSNKYATYTKNKHAVKGSVESIKSGKCHNSVYNSKPVINSNKRLKTKIPVYLNQPTKTKSVDGKNVREPPKKVTPIRPPGPTNSKSVERKLPGSLMNATKSSSAKMVPKVVKEHSNRSTPKSHKVVHVSRQRNDEAVLPRETPVMERSGTFLKDEPTFGDKTTKIDIDQ